MQIPKTKNHYGSSVGRVIASYVGGQGFKTLIGLTETLKLIVIVLSSSTQHLVMKVTGSFG